MKKALLILAQVAAVTLMAQAASATTYCHIYIFGPCGGNVKPFTWFEDSDIGAKVDAGRCSVRAKEWHQYCSAVTGVPIVGVHTSFYVQFPKGLQPVLYTQRSLHGTYISGGRATAANTQFIAP